MGRQPEGGALHHRHPFRVQQVADEVVVRGDGLSFGRGPADGAGARGVDVERAFRRRARKPLGLIEHCHDQVPALLEDGGVPGQEVGGSVEGRHRPGLGDGAGVGRALRLHLVHGLDQVDGSPGVADAPAGHAVGLGDAVERQRALHEPGLHLDRGDEGEAVVDDVLVNVVGQHPDVGVLHQHVRQGLHFGLGVGRPAGVRRRVQDQPFGLRRDRPFQVLLTQAEAALRRTRDRHGLAVGQQRDVRIRDPVRRRDDDLVAGIEGRHEGVEDDLLAAAAHGDLVGRVVQSVFPLELVADGLAQLRRPGDGGIPGLAPVHGRLRRLDDVRRRVEVGLAGAEADDVAPLRLQVAGLLGDGDGGRGLDAGKALGDERHGVFAILLCRGESVSGGRRRTLRPADGPRNREPGRGLQGPWHGIGRTLPSRQRTGARLGR